MYRVLILLFISFIVHADVRSDLWIKGVPPVQLPLSAQYMVDWETRFNPAGIRSNLPFWIEHLEIPLSLLNEDLGLGLDKKIYESMVFNKNGVPFVRWILNPEDTKYGEQIKAKLAAAGYDSSTYKYYVGYLTSSRSCIVQDPLSGVTFSIKSSTNSTGGNWQEKKETANAAKAGRMMSDLLTETITDRETRALRVLKEPLSFTFADLDQAIIVRQYDHFNSPNQSRFLIPVFSATHEINGADISKKNGNASPADFWGHHMMAPLGMALAEITMLGGIIYNSPHGQNFMIELDSSFRPTGLIYVKDYADSNIQGSIMNAIGGEPIVRLYSKFKQNKSYTDGEFYAAINPIYSGSELPPSWLGEKDVEYWKNVFIEEFARRANSIYSNSVNQKLSFNRVLGWNPMYWIWESSIPVQERYGYLDYLKSRPKNSITSEAQSATILAFPAVSSSEVLPINDWDSFLAELGDAKKLEQFKGRIEGLKNPKLEIDLIKKKQIAFQIGRSRLSELLSVKVEPGVLLDVAYALSTVDPILVSAYFYNLSAKVSTSNPTSLQRQLADSLLEKVIKYEETEMLLRNGSDTLLFELLANAEAVNSYHSPKLVEALMYRIEITKSKKMKSDLIKVLSKIGSSDPVISDFLRQKSGDYSCLMFYKI